MYYANAQSQLDDLRTLIDRVDDDLYLAKLALYARQRAFMKDMPAALLVVLSTRNTELMHRVFDRVVDNGRMLRTVFQMVRSGQLGRNSLSSSLQRAFQRWLNEASVSKLLFRVNRTRSVAARCFAAGATDTQGQRTTCAVRLVDGQGKHDVGSRDGSRPAG